MRVSKDQLRELTVELNQVLNRPVGAMDIGHISLDHNHIGYQLEEELNGRGSVFTHSTRITAREMFFMLKGMIKGASIQQREGNK